MPLSDDIHRRFQINFYVTLALLPITLFLANTSGNMHEKLLSAGVRLPPALMEHLDDLGFYAVLGTIIITSAIAIAGIVMSVRRGDKVLFGLGLKTLIIDAIYILIPYVLALGGG